MPELAYTPLADIPVIHGDLRRSFLSGKSKSIQYRKQQLLNLAYLIKDNLDRFEKAFAQDLGRPALEARMEIDGALAEIKQNLDGVDKWTKPEKTPFNIPWSLMRTKIRKEPKGVVLIIVPFNFPAWLSFSPVAGAIAAGNAVVLKPSELIPNITGLMAELWPKYLDQDMFRMVNGGVSETTKLLELQWDHILYTGNGRVGKIVATAAAKHLTPTTLELGGKCPVVIDPKCDLKSAARRLTWGKFMNSGQTCVAPDYALVPAHFQDAFVSALKEAYAEFYPTPPTSTTSIEASFTRIVTEHHAKRVKALIDGTKGTIVVGGDADVERRWVAPTIVRDVSLDDSLMSDEIFGPVLPIVPVRDVDEAIRIINSRDHPLALYVFSQDPAFKAKVFDNTQSGAAIANECIVHGTAVGLPFGGIGASGYGAHTSNFSFDTFTHKRASLDSPTWLDIVMNNRFPPYTAKKAKMLAAANAPSFPRRGAFDGSGGFFGRFFRGTGWLVVAVAMAAVAVLARQGRLEALVKLAK